RNRPADHAVLTPGDGGAAAGMRAGPSTGLAPLARDPLQVRGAFPLVVLVVRSPGMPSTFADTATRLESLLRLRSIPFGMKLFEHRQDMEAIPKIRRPSSVHTLDQVVAQAARLGWTVGITADDLVGSQCRAVVGLGAAKDAAWRSGKHMRGVWFATN